MKFDCLVRYIPFRRQRNEVQVYITALDYFVINQNTRAYTRARTEVLSKYSIKSEKTGSDIKITVRLNGEYLLT